MKWTKYTTIKETEETMYFGAVITIESKYGDSFDVKLYYRDLVIFLGSFENTSEAKRYIKHGKDKIKNIIEMLKKIGEEVDDFTSSID